MKNRMNEHYQADSLTGLYAALNDFTDAIDYLPAELARNFTLLHEVDAKYTDLQATIDQEIDLFFANPPPNYSVAHLMRILNLLSLALACADEKVSVSSATADTALKLRTRIDHAFSLLESREISATIRLGDPNHPALRSQLAMGMSRSETRREILATRRAAGGTATPDSDSRVHMSRGGGNGVKAERSGLATGGVGAANTTVVGGRKRGGGAGAASTATGSERLKGGPSRSSSAASIPHPSPQKNGEHGGGRGGGQSGRASTVASTLAAIGELSSQSLTSTLNSVPHGNMIYNYNPPDSGGTVNIESYSSDRRQQKNYTNDRRIGPDKSSGLEGDTQPGDEPVYCYCQQVSYGEMVGCDNEQCPREWFHLACVGLTQAPRGAWYCNECKPRSRGRRG